LYDYFLFSAPNSPNLFTVPLGAVYMVFVGVMFLKGFPTKGELLGDESEVESSDEKTHEGDRDTDPVAGED
ncbi:MAG: hypothetical protein SV760_06015, partial [Halobacteria archaeon]|nr:hypothetical protein [Halobacteria archaeon]